MSSLFSSGEVVRHLKTQKHYMITGTPDRVRLEKTNEPAYAYTQVDRTTTSYPIWIRSQEEMEDGRFTS